LKNRALHRFAVFTAVATFGLLGAGGLVTSHGVGMAVPDWPNTFGYNMFFFPVSQWVGGVFYEHTHRLLASGVGLCTTILAIWLHGKSAQGFLRWAGFALLVLGTGTALAMPAHWADAIVAGLSGLAALVASFVWPRCEPAQVWLRGVGIVAFLAVVLQGVLGGLRVVLFKDQLGIFHATLAQLFFALMCVIALFTSRWWEKGASINRYPSPLVWLCTVTSMLILSQLILGATMRHQHAGLAIPDFPLAYGKVWPAMDPQSVARYNQQRVEIVDANPITSLEIGLQMAHRLVALCIFATTACCAWFAWRRLSRRHVATRLALGWLGLITIQVILGAATIWTNKAADIATAHVLVGALSLALGAILTLILRRQTVLENRSSLASVRPNNELSGSFAARHAPAVGIE
jgi:cytochrome c oxidase assembly protein subunit 15